MTIQSITEKRIKIGNQEVMNKKKVSNSIRQQKLSILLLTAVDRIIQNFRKVTDSFQNERTFK